MAAKQRGGAERVAVGAVEHGNSMVLVAVSADGALLDRRRVDLTHDLPSHPFHHEGSWAVGRYLTSPWARPTSLPQAVALCRQVRESALAGARASLEALSAEVPRAITRIAIRACPALPATIEACIADARAASVADSVMYRQALAAAAEERGWTTVWYEREHVARAAAAALPRLSLDDWLATLGRQAGPPWQARHKLAATAALAAAARVVS
ncbi:MAG: hypothetical protein JSR54_04005 [Proteobacteria bacterium]|nr:hypothetical protein [Pseudomonadota bacterium]